MPEKKPSHPPRTFQEVVQSIENKSAAVRERATAISDRIALFEAWLSKLPGRVEVMCWSSDPDERRGYQCSLGLRLHRSGKSWILSFGWEHPDMNPEDSIDWKPLGDAPVNDKMLAVSMFPQLLEAIETEQESLSFRLGATAHEFDVFAATIGINKDALNVPKVDKEGK